MSAVNSYEAYTICGSDVSFLPVEKFPSRTQIQEAKPGVGQSLVGGKYRWEVIVPIWAYTASDCYFQAKVILEALELDFRILKIEPYVVVR